MNDTASAAKARRKPRDLEAEIAHQQARLQKLQDALKEKKRKEQERNAKAISALLQAEHLDQVPIETWQHHLPTLKSLLLGATSDALPGDAKEKPAPAVPGTTDTG